MTTRAKRSGGGGDDPTRRGDKGDKRGCGSGSLPVFDADTTQKKRRKMINAIPVIPFFMVAAFSSPELHAGEKGLLVRMRPSYAVRAMPSVVDYGPMTEVVSTSGAAVVPFDTFTGKSKKATRNIRRLANLAVAPGATPWDDQHLL